tara:strand:+ start:84 stop:350 length:267 start_codon:yes stop_codon:yes gene_type:complete
MLLDSAVQVRAILGAHTLLARGSSGTMGCSGQIPSILGLDSGHKGQTRVRSQSQARKFLVIPEAYILGQGPSHLLESGMMARRLSSYS